MKYELEDIQKLLELALKYNIYIDLCYIPEYVLESPEKLDGLYYGGSYKIQLGPEVRCRRIYSTLSKENLGEIADDIFKELSRDISSYIFKTLHKFEWEPEQLKYFDREEEQENYKLFKEEIKRLQNETN